ncbi:RNA exonuclease ngl2 [Clydaea vesicula]|uniref:RNA exonuclease ngl2 n=1 Tax=Clydaea vesicula TaxID=447962 RepID=A0AAD5UAG0_9FUNG|nr:RNA exonuclease ngl2 [Clydaea vesicula]KAJ3395353.1 RNA exonuclease ngl2 [Lobulomyces angularis]
MVLREFLKVPREKKDEIIKNSNDVKLSLMTYNVLAQGLIHRDSFPDATKLSLKIKHRIPKVLSEIKFLNPDCACFQEVDEFERFYKEFLIANNYDFIYQYSHETISSLENNTSECPPETVHGLLTIWKKEKVKLIDYQFIDFDNHELVFPTKITPYTKNIATICIFEFLNDLNKGFAVTNNHLYWRYQAVYEKLRQIYVLLTEVKKSRDRYNFQFFCCGDFNFEPMDIPYYILTRKELSSELRNTAEIVKHPGSDRENPIVSDENGNGDIDYKEIPPEELIDKLYTLPKLKSCYYNYANLLSKERYNCNPQWKENEVLWTGEPAYTNYGPWKGTLDYIFMLVEEGPSKVILDSVLYIPTAEELKKSLPNEEFGSDHISLMANFYIL